MRRITLDIDSRKSPLETLLIGQQQPGPSECKAQIEFNLETNKFLRKRIREFKTGER